MKKNIYYFNSLLRFYNKCRRKLDNLRKANRNVRRQDILQKHIERLFEKLTLLNAGIKQKTIAATFALSALAFVPQTADAQIGFKPVQVNPFGITSVQRYSSPALADLDADGDLDLLTGDKYGDFYYQQNTGTATNPSFAAQQTNPFGLVSNGPNYSAPTFVDLDNDGDLDIITSEYYGDFKYYQNTGTASAPAFAAPVTNPFSLTNLTGGINSTLSHATFADIDNDGDLDMLVGDDGSDFLIYFENIGTVSVPNFGTLQINPFSITQSGSWVNPTFVDIDGDNDFDLFIGDSSGNTKYFKNTGTSSAAVFGSEQVNPFSLTQIGSYSSMFFKDLNGDGRIDMLAGDEGGDFSFFAGCATTTSTISPIATCSYVSPSGLLKTTGGTFTDIITNAAGCDSIITINLTINPVLNQTITANSGVCVSGSTNIELSSSQNDVNYYLRDNSNNAIVTGPIMGTGSSLSLNTGTITSTTIYNVYAEKMTNTTSLFFDDSNNSNKKVECGNSGSVQLSGNLISLEAWIYPTEWRDINQGHIINKEYNGGSGSDQGYMIRCGNGGDISFNLGNGNWNELTTNTQPLTLNTWQHVAATYDGTSMKIYVNGILEASNTITSINFSAANNNLTIGAWAGGDGSVFGGNIDEARVWSVAKTQSEIQTNMNSCLLGSETGLAAYYKFENGAGSSILTDLSPNGNDGTLQNMDVNTSWQQGTTICSSCNLQMTQTITITVNPYVSPSISVNSGTICSGESFTITPSGTAITYTISGGNSIVSPTVDATYSVTGTDANGCVSASPVTASVTVNASPTTTAVTTNTLLCSGETAIITASGANTYTWSTSENTTTISVSPTVTTSYTVSGTGANGCVNSNIITQNVSLCTGINSIIEDQSSSIVLYPNPTNGTFYIVLPETLIGQTLTLTNTIGQVLETKIINNTVVDYNVEAVPNGIYFVLVQTQNGIISKKIIKN